MFNSGLVVFAPPMRINSFCALTGKFPWGTQNCTVHFGSWTYDLTLMDIVSEETENIPAIGTKWMANKRVKTQSHFPLGEK